MLRSLKYVVVILVVVFILDYSLVWANKYPIMKLDGQTLLKWSQQHKTLPYFQMTNIFARSNFKASSFNLLDRLEYIPEERNQGTCGNCWVWAGTALMAIELYNQCIIKDRLSIQFLNSCLYDVVNMDACCGGNSEYFRAFYLNSGFTIPWNNSNALFQDSSRQCGAGPAISCNSISTQPNYSITSFEVVQVPTVGIGTTQAIANIKNALHAGKAVYLGFFLPNEIAWNEFFDFWDFEPDLIWDPTFYCGMNYIEGEGGGHAVVIVGYDETDPQNPYWIVLNSWGTAYGARPQGTFKMAMNIDYDCMLNYNGYFINALIFEVYDVGFVCPETFCNVVADFILYYDGDRDLNFYHTNLHICEDGTFYTDDEAMGYWEVWDGVAYLNFITGCAPLYVGSMSTMHGVMKCTNGQQDPDTLPGYWYVIPGLGETISFPTTSAFP